MKLYDRNAPWTSYFAAALAALVACIDPPAVAGNPVAEIGFFSAAAVFVLCMAVVMSIYFPPIASASRAVRGARESKVNWEAWVFAPHESSKEATGELLAATVAFLSLPWWHHWLGTRKWRDGSARVSDARVQIAGEAADRLRARAMVAEAKAAAAREPPPPPVEVELARLRRERYGISRALDGNDIKATCYLEDGDDRTLIDEALKLERDRSQLEQALRLWGRFPHANPPHCDDCGKHGARAAAETRKALGQAHRLDAEKGAGK